MKKIWWLWCAGLLLLPVSGEEILVELRKASDVKINPKSLEKFKVELSTVFDRTLNRDVLKIRYALKPGEKKAQPLEISFPALTKTRWRRVDKIAVMVRGGLGHLRYNIADVNGEQFYQKGFPSPAAEWKEFSVNYSNVTPESCNIFGGRDKKLRNRKPDPPLQLGTFSYLIRPAHVAAQLRNTRFLFSLKATETELEQGMKPVESCLAAVTVTGEKYVPGQKIRQEATVAAPGIRFQEIGTEYPLKTGNREKIAFILTNPSDRKQEFSFRAVSQKVLTDDKEKFAGKVALGGGESKKIMLPFDYAQDGYYDVRLTVSCGGREFPAWTFVNVWTPAGNRGETVHAYFFGTQGSLDLFHREFPPARREQDYRNMRDAGVVVMRTPLRWKAVQPKKDGPYNWSTYDHIVKKCLEYGITPYFMVATSPNWAAADPEVCRKAPRFVYACCPDNALYAGFIAKVAERYGKKAILQVWNEPYANQYYWGGTPETYAEMVKKSFAAVRKVNPEVIVNTGACWDEVFPMTLGSFDNWPFHHHGLADTFHSTINKHRAMLTRAGKKETSLFWADECGLSVDSQLDNSELLKASEVIKKSLISRACGLGMHVCFVWRGSPRAPTSRRDNYPFMDEKHRCRPIVTAHNTMVRNMRNTVPEKDFSRPGDGCAYLLRRPQGKLLIFWRSSIAKGQILTVNFSKPVKGRLFNLYGSELAFPLSGTSYSTMLTPEPCYLQLPAEAEITGVSFASLVTAPAQKVLKTGDKETVVTVELFNPFKETLSGKFSVRADAPWQALQKEQKLSLSAGTGKKVSFTFLAAGKSSGIGYADIRFDAPERKISFSRSVRFMNCTPLTGKEKLLAALDSADNVISLRPGDVDADMFWQGSEDLSVRIFGSYDAKALKLRFEVTDDKHYQIQPTRGLFEGDSIQLAFRTPEYSQIGVALMNDGQKTFNQWKGKYPLPVDYSIVRKGCVTEYKVAIPWRNLNLKPERGTCFELCALINDNDGRCRKILLEWGGGIHGMGAVAPMNPVILE